MTRGISRPAAGPRGGLRVLAACIALSLPLAAPRHAAAGLVLTAQAVTVNAGTSGDSFDLVLTNTGPGAVTIGGFAFELTTTNAAISFTGVTTGTSPSPYIFDGLGLIGSNIGAVVSGQDIRASDLYSVIGSGAAVGSGASVGLGHVLFNVSSAASGTISVQIAPAPATSLSDTSFPIPNDLPITTLNNGSITIRPSSVPEPASIGLIGSGVALSAVFMARRRRAG